MRTSAAKENHYSVINRVMLRFRPIAPKPAGGDAVSAAAEKSDALKIGKRTKRKYVRIRRRQSTKKRTGDANGRQSPPEKSGVEDGSSPEKGVVTLQLMPERSERGKSSGSSAATVVQRNIPDKNWSSVYDEVNRSKVDSGGGVMEEVGAVRSVIKTWITVECVTDKFIDSGVGVGFSDWERINKLQADTCPGFVSDGTHNVVWVNEAYRRMVGEVAKNGIMVWLAVKEELPDFSPTFACRVRMSQQTKHGQKWNRIVPCDVWRMDFPGFAWKLDVSTALCLGI